MTEETPKNGLEPLIVEMCGSLENHRDIMGYLAGLRKKHLDVTRENLAFALSAKMKGKRRGVILSGAIYDIILPGIRPLPLEMRFLTETLVKYNLYASVVYRNGPQGAEAAFVVIHRDYNRAVEYTNRIKTMAGSEINPINRIIAGSVVVTERFANGTRTLPGLVEALDCLEHDQLYCCSMNFCYYLQIDPKKLYQISQERGWAVFALYRQPKEGEKEEELEEYKFYHCFVALLIAKEQSIIEWGKEHIPQVFEVCREAERDLVREAKERAEILNQDSNIQPMQ